MKKPLLLSFVILATACKTKGDACIKVTTALDPIAKDLDAVAAASESATPPSPADQGSCARLSEDVRRLESAEGKLAVLVTNDDTLAKNLNAYRGHVSVWAKATKKAQAGCLSRDGNAMTAGLSEAIQHRVQLAPVKSDIMTYCKAP